MKSENLKFRLAVVAGVALISLWLTLPTFRYFSSVGGSGKVAATELETLRKSSVPLGLDLQGGVDVLLAIDREKTAAAKVEAFAEDLRREFQRQSPTIDASVEVTSGGQSIVLVLNKATQERSVDNILQRGAQKTIFPNYVAGSVKASAPLSLEVNGELLRQDMESAIDSSLKVLRDRVDKLGVTQPIVYRQGTDRIRVQIPGEKDPTAVVAAVIRPAQLEFRGVLTGKAPSRPDGSYEDNSAEYIDIATGRIIKPLPPGYEVKPHSKDSRQGAKNVQAFIVVRKKVEMTGAKVKDARVTMRDASLSGGGVEVTLEFSADGAAQFAEISEKNLKKPLAIVLDGVVYSAPIVQTKISGGVCSITGNFTIEEGRNLSLVLKAGALPAELVVKDQRIVEATLGADSIAASVRALIIGSIFVSALMVVYYGGAGVVAVVAVILNVLLIFAFMKLANATLTLSGIGGILLTVGMAVDANVLIYERIREELHAGKTLKQAVSTGFERAFTVIFDGNITTLLSGLVLLQFGEGSVRGFALSLNVGIMATLFTGLFVTKTLVEGWMHLTQKIGVGKIEIFRNKFYLPFVSWRRYSYAFSISLFIISVLWVMPFKPFPGSNWGVDFEGGLVTELRTEKALQAQDIAKADSTWRVQKVAGENKFIVRAKVESGQTLASVKKSVEAGLDKTLGKGAYSVLASEAVSNEVGQEFTRSAVIACILASVFILIYMAYRFEPIFGIAAVIALFHDLLITYGLFNILGSVHLAGEVTLDIIAALLVILGYSVNDTIIIFDRVRENMKLHPGMEMEKLINTSICESMNRTVMTVGTVVIVLLAMLVVGGSGLFDFALVLLIGILKGTYSSSFVASPLLFQLHRRQHAKKAVEGRRASARA